MLIPNVTSSDLNDYIAGIIIGMVLPHNVIMEFNFSNSGSNRFTHT
jgi:hypothetical protein